MNVNLGQVCRLYGVSGYSVLVNPMSINSLMEFWIRPSSISMLGQTGVPRLLHLRGFQAC